MSATLNGQLAGGGSTAQGCDFRAFGLTVSCELPVRGADAAGLPGEVHDVHVALADADRLLSAFSRTEATCVLERFLPDGSLGMRVELAEDDSYRVLAPGHGDFLIAGGGRLVHCAPAPGAAEWLWQRPFFGQVLPLAATLQGFELFHASAVALHGRAVAFTGRSGAGKTSIAAHLAAGGAALLTDDVLSLECADGHVIAHRGAPTANVAAEQLEAMSAEGRDRLGAPVGTSEKVQIALSCMPSSSLPLGYLYFVERGAEVDGISFERVEPPDPQLLLGATFLPHVVTPGRLMTQLHTCSEVARRAQTFRLLAPYSVPAPALAAAVRDHVAAPL